MDPLRFSSSAGTAEVGSSPSSIVLATAPCFSPQRRRVGYSELGGGSGFRCECDSVGSKWVFNGSRSCEYAGRIAEAISTVGSSDIDVGEFPTASSQCGPWCSTHEWPSCQDNCGAEHLRSIVGRFGESSACIWSCPLFSSSSRPRRGRRTIWKMRISTS